MSESYQTTASILDDIMNWAMNLMGGDSSNDRNDPLQDSSVRFDDIVGIDEYKEEVLELMDYLKNPEKYEKVGAKIPKGMLLVGPVISYTRLGVNLTRFL